MEHGMSDARMAPQAAEVLRAAIVDVDGDEVFAIGDVANGQIVAVEITCRGNEDRVPALLGRPRPGQVVIHNHPSGNLQPSEADLYLAGKYGEDGIGVVIVDNDVQRSRWVVEPHVSQAISIDDATVTAVFREAFPRVMPDHEVRPAQIEMAVEVAHALNDEKVSILEAGTGTGKSLAYLVPAALWARANEAKVVVATHTLTLQGQLASSDLPLLPKAGLPLKWATLRGRSNYLCRRKLEEAALEVGVDPSPFTGREPQAPAPPAEAQPQRRQVVEALVRAAAAGEGHRQALQFSVDPDVWEDVRSDHEQTLRARCPHFDRCFYYSARRKAAEAQLLVVNHHLVLADLSIKADSGGDGILPKFDRLILDEGHHLEGAATSLLRDQLTARSITRAIARLMGSKRRKGSLQRLFRRFGSKTSPLPEIDRDRFKRTSGMLLSMLPQAKAVAEASLEAIAAALLEDTPAPRRLTPELREDTVWTATIEPCLTDLASILGEVARLLDRLEDLLDGLPPSDRLAEPQPVFELGRVHRLLGGHARLCSAFVQDPKREPGGGEVVRWFESARNRKGPPTTALVAAPLEVGPILRRTVFDPLSSTVITSATLAVRKTFDHYRARVGLQPPAPRSTTYDRDDLELDAILGDLGRPDDPADPDPVQTALFDSPFDYRTQAMLGLPRDLPPPESPEWASVIARATTAALHVARGGAFVLCTSFAMVDHLHAHAQEKLGDRMLLLRQGEMGRTRLLHRFRDAGNAVLFGTDSFWEGVSVKGDALRLVVIPRLPFRVPTEPIQQARAELIRSRGLDPFRTHQLPESVLRLRQGFGRLIRTRTDHGAVLILDRRVLDRWYGRVFLSSLPPATRTTGPTRAVLRTIRDFLRQRDQR